MIEPEVTAVLGRRYVALLLDSSLVAAAGLGVAYQRSEAFTVVGRDSTDAPLVDPADFDRMKSLLDFTILGRSDFLGVNVVRAQEIGDSVRVFAGDSYRMGLIAAALVAAIVFFAIPALIARTPGMVPVNLTIRKTDGTKAGVGAHLKRSVMGVIDMFPGIVPGLLGMLVASTTPRHQRIGDRVADTVVLDRTVAEFTTSEPHGEPLAIPIQAAPTEGDISSRGVHATADQLQVSAPDLVGAPNDQPAPQSEPVAEVRSHTAVHHDPVHPDPIPASRASNTAASAADPLPPPPVHRKANADRSPAFGLHQPHGTTEADRSNPLPLADRVDSVRPGGVDPARGEAATDDAASKVADEAFTTRQWDPPRVEPAPVWQPTPLEPAKIEAPDPHDGRTLDDVVLADPSVGELIGRDPIAADTEGHRTEQQSSSHEGGSARAPVWSDKWRAWMYWDSAARCWLRHDTESNTWIPVE